MKRFTCQLEGSFGHRGKRFFNPLKLHFWITLLSFHAFGILVPLSCVYKWAFRTTVLRTQMDVWYHYVT